MSVTPQETNTLTLPGRKRYPTLLSPLILRDREIKNRIVFGPHKLNYADNGHASRQHLAYYLERARGGAGTIVVEAMPIHQTAVYTRADFKPDDDAVIPSFREIADAVAPYGTILLQQLYHIGSVGAMENSFAPLWSPSSYPGLLEPWGSHAMREHEIEEIIKGFVSAAGRWRKPDFMA